MSIRERLARTPPGYRYSIGRILAIYSGLMVTLLLAALDQTIVATALPQIVGDLGGLTQYSWVFTAYMLATTVTVPLYGRLGDVYGRRPLFYRDPIFLVGSALCGLAQGMTQLVIFRCDPGNRRRRVVPALARGDRLDRPPRDRGRYQGLIGAVFAAASIIGPAVGGFIVDNTSWRWIFYVNLPVGGVALIVIWITMPSGRERAEHSIDWLGAGLLAAGTAALLLGLVWGGREYAWTSPTSCRRARRCGVLSSRSRCGSGAWRSRSCRSTILRNPIVLSSILCMALIGMAMFGTIAYVPLFVQGVIGTSATSSGVVLTPLMLGAVTTSIITGQLVSRTGRYRANVVVGPLILAIGMILLWRMDVHTTNREAARNMVVAGIGIGSVMQVFVLSVQNAVRALRWAPRPR